MSSFYHDNRNVHLGRWRRTEGRAPLSRFSGLFAPLYTCFPCSLIECLLVVLQTLKRHLMAGQRWLNRFQKARPDDLEEMMTLARDAEEIQVPFYLFYRF